MSNRLLKVLGPVVAIVLAAVVVLWFLRKADPHSHERASRPSQSGNQTLPDFELTPLASQRGKPLHLSDLKGRIFLINFWATWCTSCVIEMPSLVKLRERFQGRGFEVIGLNLDDSDSGDIDAMVQRLGITFPIYRDPGQKMVDYFNVAEIPFSVVVDRERKILYQYLGDQNWDSAQLKQRVEEWLK